MIDHRQFFDDISKLLDVTSLDDWYNITRQDVMKYNSHLLHEHYGGSLLKALKAVYPHHNWQRTEFNKFTQTQLYHKQIKNHRLIFEKIAKQLNVRKFQDWYQVTAADIEEKGGATLAMILRDYYRSSHILALQTIYPHYNWESWRFLRVKKGFWEDDV